MKSYIDQGLDVISQAADDPLGRFILRATRPLAQRGLDQVRGAFNETVDRIKRAIGDGEDGSVRVRRRRVVVVDAVIEDEDQR